MTPLRRSATTRASPGETRKKSILKKSESVRGGNSRSGGRRAATTTTAAANPVGSAKADPERENLLAASEQDGSDSQTGTPRSQRHNPGAAAAAMALQGAITYSGGLIGARTKRAGDFSFYYREEDAGYAATGASEDADAGEGKGADAEEAARPTDRTAAGAAAGSVVRRGQECHQREDQTGAAAFSSSLPNVRTVKSTSSPSVTSSGAPPRTPPAAAVIAGVVGGGHMVAASTSSSVFSPCSATPPSILASNERLAFERGNSSAHAAALAAAASKAAAAVAATVVTAAPPSSRDIQTSTTTLAAAKRKFERGRDPSHLANRDNSASRCAARDDDSGGFLGNGARKNRT